MQKRVFLLALVIVNICVARPRECVSYENQLEASQDIIVASYNLDLENVRKLLQDSRLANARLGTSHEKIARKLGPSLPIGRENWTPLIAVANSEADSLATRGENRESWDSANPRPNSVQETGRSRRVSIAEALISSGADVDKDDGHGVTPLHAAIRMGHSDLVHLLIASNSVVNTKTKTYIDDTGGRTPVHDAVAYPSILTELIFAGAHVNSKDDDGMTPLHLAVRDSNMESVRILIAAGANLLAVDNEGRTPSYWCRQFEAPINSPILDVPELRGIVSAVDEIRFQSSYNRHQRDIAGFLKELTEIHKNRNLEAIKGEMPP